jgi:hypothetical protein
MAAVGVEKYPQLDAETEFAETGPQGSALGPGIIEKGVVGVKKNTFVFRPHCIQ